MLATLRSWHQRRPFLFTALALAAWLLLTIGWRPLAVPDEGRYATVALDMAHSGQWTVPLLNGMPFFHKPPLFYWITGAALDLFGNHAWAARLASALGAWCMGMGLYAFMRRYSSARQANWSLLLLASLPLYFGAAQYANLDMLVAGMISMTIFASAHTALRIAQGLHYRAWLWATYALAAIGMLAKGLIGIVLPAGVLVLWLLWLGQWRVLLRMLSIVGIGIFAVISLPWFFLVERQHPGFFHYFFIYQHFTRFTTTGFNNQHPFYFYPAAILLASLPWTLWLPVALKRWWAQHAPLASWLQPVPLQSESSLLRFWWVWLVVIVGFFSLPASKLIGYILPCLPAWAALLTLATQQGTPSKAPVRTLLASATFCVSVILAVTLVMGKDTARTGANGLLPHYQPSDTVVMLDEYRYDLPFYLNQPTNYAWVVSDWSDPNIMVRDNWRKELAEAAIYNPSRAAQLLVKPQDLPVRLCQALQKGNVWLWGDAQSGKRYPFLVQLTPAVAQAAQLRKNNFESVWQLTPEQGRTLFNCP